MSGSIFYNKASVIGLALSMAFALNAEGASLPPNNNVTTANSFTIGGSVSGLLSGRTITLNNNGNYAMKVSTNGRFLLPSSFAKDTTYNLTIGIQPSQQTCVVSKGTGTVISTNIISVSISCTLNTYTIGGSVSGLASGSSIVINNNARAVIRIGANGDFALPGTYADGTAYNVTIATQPGRQTCMVTNGNSRVNGKITNISITCTTSSFTIGGNVSGLGVGKSLILNNNGSTAMTLATNGSFTLPSSFTGSFAYNITVGAQPSGQNCSVSNGSGSTGNTNISKVNVVCADINAAPTIAGSPVTTIVASNIYSFTPAARDINGEILAFSIANKPSWATFNTATGQLSGTPISTGIYSNIVISVSDGTTTTSLTAFNITVQPKTGDAVLSWIAPTQNSDGSALTDLTGYVVYYGTSANTNELTNSITISNGNTTSTTINGLNRGTTYYFAIASVSATGGEGNKSIPASKTI